MQRSKTQGGGSESGYKRSVMEGEKEGRTEG